MTIKDVMQLARNNYLQTCDIKKFSEELRRKSERVGKKMLATISRKKKKNSKR
jgi:hypothetical protein